MKREKKLTKRERKALSPRPTQQANRSGEHIHCVACGRHIDAIEFDAGTIDDPPTATWVVCKHKSTYPACVECVDAAKERLAEHDTTGLPVRRARAWH